MSALDQCKFIRASYLDGTLSLSSAKEKPTKHRCAYETLRTIEEGINGNATFDNQTNQSINKIVEKIFNSYIDRYYSFSNLCQRIWDYFQSFVGETDIIKIKKCFEDIQSKCTDFDSKHDKNKTVVLNEEQTEIPLFTEYQWTSSLGIQDLDQFLTEEFQDILNNTHSKDRNTHTEQAVLLFSLNSSFLNRQLEAHWQFLDALASCTPKTLKMTTHLMQQLAGIKHKLIEEESYELLDDYDSANRDEMCEIITKYKSKKIQSMQLKLAKVHPRLLKIVLTKQDLPEDCKLWSLEEEIEKDLLSPKKLSLLRDEDLEDRVCILLTIQEADLTRQKQTLIPLLAESFLEGDLKKKVEYFYNLVIDLSSRDPRKTITNLREAIILAQKILPVLKPMSSEDRSTFFIHARYLFNRDSIFDPNPDPNEPIDNLFSIMQIFHNLAALPTPEDRIRVVYFIYILSQPITFFKSLIIKDSPTDQSNFINEKYKSSDAMRLRKKVIFIQQTCPQLIPLLSPLGKVEISNYILKICEIYKLIRESDKNDYRDLIALDVIKIESESRCNIVKLVQLFNPNGLTEYNFDYSNLKLHFYSLAASFNNIWQRAQLLRFYFETEEKPLEIYNIVAINLFLLTRGSDAAAPYLLETEEI